MKVLTAFAVCASVQSILAASLAFTWIQGSNVTDQRAVYASVDATNTPGARSMHCTDYASLSSLLYLFGGTSSVGMLSDLWVYDATRNQWALLTGVPNATNLLPVYGTKGTPSATTSPGGLRGTGCALVSSYFHVFGGFGRYNAANSFASFNDVWRIDVRGALQWAWLSGNSSVTLSRNATVGVESASILPYARETLALTAHPCLPLLFLHGGVGFDIADDYGKFNDLWQYNTTSNGWTWISGALTVNSDGNYDALQTSPQTAVPPARCRHQLVAERTTGDLFLYGGEDKNYNALGDLWQYSTISHTWKWIGGSQTSNLVAVLGPVGEFAAGYAPGARHSFSLTQRGNRRQLLFSAGYLNGRKDDAWLYDLDSNQWAFIGGMNGTGVPGQYGTFGQWSLTSYFGSRMFHSVNCDDAGDVCFMFGGFGWDAQGTSGSLSDLWRLDFNNPSSTSSLLVALTTSPVQSSLMLASSTLATTTAAVVTASLADSSSILPSATKVSTTAAQIIVSTFYSAPAIATTSSSDLPLMRVQSDKLVESPATQTDDGPTVLMVAALTAVVCVVTIAAAAGVLVYRRSVRGVNSSFKQYLAARLSIISGYVDDSHFRDNPLYDRDNLFPPVLSPASSSGNDLASA